MAQLNQHFDASAVEPAVPFELLPPGKYPAQIVNSEMRPTKTGGGQFLWLEMDVIEGAYQGRKIWDQINLVNPSPQAVEIAQRTLSAICHALGQLQVTDSEQLHFRPLLVTLAVEPDSRDKHKPAEEQRRQNRVKGYAAISGTVPPRSNAAPPPMASRPAAPPTRPATNGTPTAPWRRAG